MKTIAIAAAVLVASVSAANAKCSKSALAGTWILNSAGSSYTATISNGVLTTSIIGTPVKVALGDNCRGVGSLTQGMNTYPVRFASERISSSSSLKPNLLMMSIEYSPNSGSGYVLHRKN